MLPPLPSRSTGTPVSPNCARINSFQRPHSHAPRPAGTSRQSPAARGVLPLEHPRPSVFRISVSTCRRSILFARNAARRAATSASISAILGLSAATRRLAARVSSRPAILSAASVEAALCRHVPASAALALPGRLERRFEQTQIAKRLLKCRLAQFLFKPTYFEQSLAGRAIPPSLKPLRPVRQAGAGYRQTQPARARPA